jgi:hypothetical protein
LILRGYSSAGNYGSSRLEFDEGYGVEIANAINLEEPWRLKGAYATLEDLFISSRGEEPPMPQPSGLRAPVPGVRMRSPARLYRCSIIGFGGHGVHVESYFNSDTDQQNVNDWVVEDCHIENNVLWGLKANGYNSSAGNMRGGMLISNGLGGFYDSSFLGNAYVGVHIETNLYSAVPGRAYIIEGNVNRTTVLGCYTESDLLPALVLSTTATVMGGTQGAGFEDPHGIIGVNGHFIPTVFRTEAPPLPGGPNRYVDLYAGMRGGTTNVLGWQSYQDDTHFFLKYEDDPSDAYRGYYVLYRGSQRYLALSTNMASGGAGKVVFPMGISLAGQNAPAKRFVTGNVPPTTGVAGDIVFNTEPSPGGYVGWVCTVGGDPAQWKAFGPIAT